jgi:hypothetical protein
MRSNNVPFFSDNLPKKSSAAYTKGQVSIMRLLELQFLNKYNNFQVISAKVWKVSLKIPAVTFQ